MMEKIKAVAREYLKDSAHDFAHTLRVYKNCLVIAEDMPSVDLELLSVASLLHDVAKVKEDEDATGKTDHAVLGAQMALQILLELGFGEEFARKVSDIISTHRFRADNPPQTLEAKILFDADKLDVLGAIGVARSFAIAGRYGQDLYNDVCVEDYIRDNLIGGSAKGRIKDISKHTPKMEFMLKLRLVPDRMFTQKGAQLARERLEYMESFFKRLDQEVL